MKQQIALGALNGHVAEMYGGHPIITAFGHERRSIETFDELNETYYDGAWRAQFVSGIIMPTMMFIGNLGYVLIAVIGGLLVTRRSLAIGDVQAFIQYGRQFSMPITQLSGITNTIQLTMVSAERVFELLDEPEETPDADAAPAIAAPRGAVQFDHVGFRYKEDVPLIDDMTLDIAPGQMIAIVGPTGAGKTTLVNLLMRFYDVNSGAIRVDGVDIRQLKRGELRRMFGMVLQDTWLFSGTIRDNIAYGWPWRRRRSSPMPNTTASSGRSRPRATPTAGPIARTGSRTPRRWRPSRRSTAIRWRCRKPSPRCATSPSSSIARTRGATASRSTPTTPTTA
jgi:ATP-binding cassette subfamily B protein